MTTRVQPQDKTVTTNGINLHYLDWGTVGKPVVVMIHGLRGHAHSWDDVSAALCPDFHVLSLDQRGRGDTDWTKDGDYTTDAYVADLEGFCAALKLDSFILVGQSMGGRNSMASTTLKTAVLTPMPNASEITATAVKARLFASPRAL